MSCKGFTMSSKSRAGQRIDENVNDSWTPLNYSLTKVRKEIRLRRVEKRKKKALRKRRKNQRKMMR